MKLYGMKLNQSTNNEMTHLKIRHHKVTGVVMLLMVLYGSILYY